MESSTGQQVVDQYSSDVNLVAPDPLWTAKSESDSWSFTIVLREGSGWYAGYVELYAEYVELPDPNAVRKPQPKFGWRG